MADGVNVAGKASSCFERKRFCFFPTGFQRYLQLWFLWTGVWFISLLWMALQVVVYQCLAPAGGTQQQEGEHEFNIFLVLSVFFFFSMQMCCLTFENLLISCYQPAVKTTNPPTSLSWDRNFPRLQGLGIVQEQYHNINPGRVARLGTKLSLWRNWPQLLFSCCLCSLLCKYVFCTKYSILNWIWSWECKATVRW